VEAVLFDLGGVLVDVAGAGVMCELTGVDSEDEVWRRWLGCRWVRAFERGQCLPEEFATGVVDDWCLDVDPGKFLEGFASWLSGPYEGAEALLDDVGERVVLGCLSNTNSVHWECGFGRWPLLERFDHRFLSFALGMVKPDRQIFDHVVQTLGVEPGRVLFLDDNLVNVEGARTVGLRAAHVRGVAAARQALAANGLVAGASTTSSSPPSNASTGSTTAASTARSA
jgi:HAD superfamily hydrolase (TIGR01509 family)